MRASSVIRLFAGFDLAVTAMFAVPFLATLMLSLLFSLNGWVGQPADMPEISALSMLFVNLMGTLGVIWALARLIFPVPRLGWLDAWGRIWVSALLIFYMVQPGVPVMICIFIASELIGAWMQLWALRIPEI